MDITNCDKEIIIITLLCFFHHENKYVFSIMKNILLLMVFENGALLTLFILLFCLYFFCPFYFSFSKVFKVWWKSLSLCFFLNHENDFYFILWKIYGACKNKKIIVHNMVKKNSKFASYNIFKAKGTTSFIMWSWW